MKLPPSFFQRTDTVRIAKDLLGKCLYSDLHGEGITGGIIVETEAYCGPEDKACHAYLGRFTKRTETMYREGGVAYVYLIYGMYHLLNFVTHTQNEPHAVLIRAIEPTVGLDVMLCRRKLQKVERRLTGGPGLLTQALGITKEQNGLVIGGDELWVEDCGHNIAETDIMTGPRVGVGYAEEYAQLPWRFWVRGNKWVSPAK
jgi:DNA-3-methyladenine glycosylase